MPKMTTDTDRTRRGPNAPPSQAEIGLVETRVHGAANVGEAERGDAAVQRRDDGAQEHREHADERPRRNDRARLRGNIVWMAEALRWCGGASSRKFPDETPGKVPSHPHFAADLASDPRL